jgi:hypothetical protein
MLTAFQAPGSNIVPEFPVKIQHGAERSTPWNKLVAEILATKAHDQLVAETTVPIDKLPDAMNLKFAFDSEIMSKEALKARMIERVGYELKQKAKAASPEKRSASLKAMRISDRRRDVRPFHSSLANHPLKITQQKLMARLEGIKVLPFPEKVKAHIEKSLKGLGNDVMSDEETDEEISIGRSKSLAHYHSPCIHPDIYVFLHQLDAMIKKHQPEFLYTPTKRGNRPLHRLEGVRIKTVTRPPSGLPINWYNLDWFNTQSSAVKVYCNTQARAHLPVSPS